MCGEGLLCKCAKALPVRRTGIFIFGAMPLHSLFQSVEKVRLELVFSDRYGRMGKGDARCWNAGKWIETW